MKANDAPEKICINSNLEKRTWLIGKGDSSFIEYVRTDAFIEKACEWLKENFSFDEAEYCRTNIYNTESMIYYFKKYMEVSYENRN